MNLLSLQLVSDVSTYLEKVGYLPISIKTSISTSSLTSQSDIFNYLPWIDDVFTILFCKSTGDYTKAYFSMTNEQITFFAFDSNSVLSGIWKYLSNLGGV